MYYKLGQACVTNWGSFVLLQTTANVITNWGKCCYKLGQLLQISATVITKQGSYYKLGQSVLQIGAGIIKQGNYYKLEHNTCPCSILLKKISLYRLNIHLLNELYKFYEKT